MKPFQWTFGPGALFTALLLTGCATSVTLEPYNPLGAKPLPKAEQVTICVQPFEDNTKNGFANKRWVGSRYNVVGLLDKDYELKAGSISGEVTQAVADELAARGFQVITGGGAHEECDYIVKGGIRKFWCKVFFDVTTNMVLEAELVDADSGKTLWRKKEQKDTLEEPNELLMSPEQEPQWIAENLRRSRDYVVRKLLRDEKFLYILTRKAQ